MKSLSQIRVQLTSGGYELSRHAFRRIVERNISELEIREVGHNVVIIEDYPADKYAPSCLLLGYTLRLFGLCTFKCLARITRPRG